MPDYTPGTPSWVDLGSPDVDASISFYGGLFGWSASDPLPDAGGYRFFEQDGKMVGGLGPLMQEGQPPAWLNYVTVADADETVAKARSASGSPGATPARRSSTSRSRSRGTSSTRATPRPPSRSTPRSSAGMPTPPR